MCLGVQVFYWLSKEDPGSSPRNLATKYYFVLAEDPVDTVRRLLMQLSARREPAVRGCVDPLL